MEPSGCSVSAGDLTAGTSPIVGMYTYRQGQMKGGGGVSLLLYTAYMGHRRDCSTCGFGLYNDRFAVVASRRASVVSLLYVCGVSFLADRSGGPS